MSAPLGNAALTQLAQELGRPLATLTVLSHGADPFGCGTPAHVAHAEWFADLWRQHMPARGGHLRRLHYRLVVEVSPIAMVSGAPYLNTTRCWGQLKTAGLWARYLGLLDPDSFADKRPAVREFFVDLDEGDEPAAILHEPAKELGEGFGFVHLMQPSMPALHPGVLRELIETEVRRYYDPTIRERAAEQNQALEDQIDALNETLAPGHERELEALRSELAKIQEQLEPIREQLKPIAKRARAWRERGEKLYRTIANEMREEMPDFSAVEWPEPAAGDEHPNPLFDSTRDYLEQIEVYKAHQGRPTERRARRKPNGRAP